jgi:hypothetical protein
MSWSGCINCSTDIAQYEKGGVTFNSTIYKVVAVPETRNIWIKAAEYSDWIKIDLSEVF